MRVRPCCLVFVQNPIFLGVDQSPVISVGELRQNQALHIIDIESPLPDTLSFIESGHAKTRNTPLCLLILPLSFS